MTTAPLTPALPETPDTPAAEQDRIDALANVLAGHLPVTDDAVAPLADTLARAALAHLDTTEPRTPVDDRHIVDFTDGETFGLQHPLACRPNLLDCPVNDALIDLPWQPVDEPGRYVVTLTDEGLIVGERVQ